MTSSAREPELDLSHPSEPSNRRRRRFQFAGFTGIQLLTILLLLAAAGWGMWVTRTLLSPKQERIVAVRLSGLVGEYVQAQARSATPPEQVEREMRAFMASLDGQMAERASKGETVLVAEAVLTRNVPDITDEVRRAVYSSGIAIPRPASPAELEARQAAAAATQAMPPQTVAPRAPAEAAAIPPGAPATSPFANTHDASGN